MLSSRLIAHRGNVSGPDKDLENTLLAIRNCIGLGYEVEIDVRYYNGNLYLGHDSANKNNTITHKFIQENTKHLWVHCKTVETLTHFRQVYWGSELSYFYHNNDDVALTSKKHLWIHPNSEYVVEGSIGVLPEKSKYDYSFDNLHSVCTDYPDYIKNEEITTAFELKKFV